MVSALNIPARYRALILFITIIAFIGLSTRLHYHDQPFKHQVKQIFYHQNRNGGNRQSWYQPWTWDHGSRTGVPGWKEQEEQVAEKAGVEVDRVAATRRRIMDVQAQCIRDEGIWEREYGYVGLLQCGVGCH